MAVSTHCIRWNTLNIWINRMLTQNQTKRNQTNILLHFTPHKNSSYLKANKQDPVIGTVNRLALESFMIQSHIGY